MANHINDANIKGSHVNITISRVVRAAREADGSLRVRLDALHCVLPRATTRNSNAITWCQLHCMATIVSICESSSILCVSIPCEMREEQRRSMAAQLEQIRYGIQETEAQAALLTATVSRTIRVHVYVYNVRVCLC